MQKFVTDSYFWWLIATKKLRMQYKFGKFWTCTTYKDILHRR